MKKAYLAAIAIVIVFIVALVYAFTPMFHQPVGTPVVKVSPSPTLSPSSTPYNFTRTPSTYATELSQYEVNVTQGETFQINVTITSSVNQTATFTPQIQLTGYGNAAWNSSKDSHKVYNATFSQESLVLEPQAKASTLLTINIAQDAPFGRYLFAVGNVALTVNVAPKPIGAPIQSVSNYYLPYHDNESKIFVISANASYGTYPFPTVTRPPSVHNDSVVAKNGEPCVIINVTLRNDYSTQNPAPNPVPVNSSLVYVSLTANIFNGENQVSSKDITNANWISSLGANSAFTSLHYGESTTLNIYLATNNTDITSFQLHPRYIGALPPP